MPLESGLVALVGLNGSGKSRLLRIIDGALSGKGTAGVTTHLTFRVVTGDGESRTQAWLPLVDPVVTSGGVGLQQVLLMDMVRDDVRRQVREYLDAGGDDGPSPDPAFVEHMESIFGPDLTQALREPGRPEQLGPAARYVSPIDAGESLVDGGLFAWVQRDGRTPELWAAVDPTTETAARRFLTDLDDSWDAAATEWEVQSDGAPAWDAVESDYLHYAHDHRYVPGEQNPAAGHLLPVPALQVRGPRSSKQWPRVLSDDVDLGEVTDRTRALIARMVGHREVLGAWLSEAPDPTDDDSVDPEDRLGSEAAMAYQTAEALGDYDWPPAVVPLISSRATELFRQLYPDAPALECRLAPMSQWLLGDAVSWVALDKPSGQWVNVAALSSSQIRWARLAIHLAGTGDRLGGFALFDEPEAGLHRTAQLAFAQGLARVTRQSQATIVVATHSPLVAAEADSVILVERDDRGQVCARPLGASITDSMEALGMLPEDLLAWADITLLVEGVHDRLVVDRLLGDTLRRTRTMVLPIDGVKDSGTVVTADVLSKFTAKPMVLLIDGLGSHAQALWAKAVQHAEAGDTQQARQALNQFKGAGYEEKFLRAAGHTLLEQGHLGRLSVVSLSVPDILDLLPAEAFEKGADWTALRREHKQKRLPGESFKAYLARTHKIRFSNAQITSALDGMDHVPDDLTRLREALETLSRALKDNQPGSPLR